MILPCDTWQLLGGLSPAQFMSRYWQRKPLLIRNSLPALPAGLTRARMFQLAGRDDAESRIVSRVRRRWSLEHGPFPASALRARETPWTLLVQGVNLFDPAADAILRRFDFIPQTRLDDLMVSWATDQGGVGPHFDSYDVFLLQLAGRRRWRLSRQKDRRLDARAPLKILAGFRPQEEHVLDPGDMLYLPPGFAHEGVAIGECMTASIGFRAASATELARGVLEGLADTIARPGHFTDPGRRPTAHPGLIDDFQVDETLRLIGDLRPTRSQVLRHIGTSLSEPKPQVVFDAPHPRLSAAAFAQAVRRHGIRLDLRTGMLYRGTSVFINGEAHGLPRAASALRQLADRRSLPAGSALGAAAGTLIYAWYTHGWLHPGEHP
ncbi:MAG: cupin domain-containing protein [Burkholderiales bacterium]|nr:cupin domain-containing protein [Burkholderiales bacterium]